MNLIDRTVAVFAPRAALRRASARSALSVVQRGYAAARTDRRTEGWQATGTSARAEATNTAAIRNRVRSLVRDNGYAAKALTSLVDHVVGAGILGTPRTAERGRDRGEALRAAWTAWQDQADYDDPDGSWHTMQALAVRAMFEGGECLVRRRRLPPDGSGRVPLRLQLLEPDVLDATRWGQTDDGGLIDRGIEYDGAGRKVAYWLWPYHPGDAAVSTRRAWQSERVPSSQIIQLFERQRPGQDRGVSVFAPAVMTLKDLSAYFEAELVRKKIESCLAAFITLNDDSDLGSQASVDPITGSQQQRFEPGMITRLQAGESVTIAQPASHSGIGDFAQTQLREVAAGLGVMYEMLTGDFSNVNYSSWRAGNHGFQRRVEALQWLTVIPRLCERVAAWWNDAAMAAGVVTSPAQFSWEPPGFISVDPLKDAKADYENLRMGKVTPSELAAQRGWNYQEFLARMVEDMTAADAAFAGIGGGMFDGDPRKNPKAAPAQTAEPQG